MDACSLILNTRGYIKWVKMLANCIVDFLNTCNWVLLYASFYNFTSILNALTKMIQIYIRVHNKTRHGCCFFHI